MNMEIFQDNLAFCKNLNSKASTDFPLSLMGHLKKQQKIPNPKHLKYEYEMLSMKGNSQIAKDHKHWSNHWFYLSALKE